MKLMGARVMLAGAVLVAGFGCASSAPPEVMSADLSDRGDDAPHGKGASTEKTSGKRSSARGPSLDRQGCDPSGKAIVVVQKGGDGQVNRWRYFAIVRRGSGNVRVLKCEASDNNGDGYVDARYFYDDRGRLTLEQRDLDFDGHAEVIADYSHFSYGHLKHARDLN